MPCSGSGSRSAPATSHTIRGRQGGCVAFDILWRVTLGLPYDVFTRDLVIVVAYATAAVFCATRWQHGHWARVGAMAAALGAVLKAFSLIAWVLYANDVGVLMDFKALDGFDDVLGWLDVLVLVGVLIAILMERDARPARRPV